MPRLLFGHDQTVADFVVARLPPETTFGPMVAVGVLADNGCLIGGIVYHNHRPRYGTLEFSGAALSPRAFSPRTVEACLSFPFQRLLNVQKLWAQTSLRNLRAQKLLKGVGLTPEAVLNSHYGPGHHARVYRLLKSEWQVRYPQQRMAA